MAPWFHSMINPKIRSATRIVSALSHLQFVLNDRAKGRGSIKAISASKTKKIMTIR